jgi:hypothetical protein
MKKVCRYRKPITECVPNVMNRTYSCLETCTLYDKINIVQTGLTTST